MLILKVQGIHNCCYQSVKWWNSVLQKVTYHISRKVWHWLLDQHVTPSLSSLYHLGHHQLVILLLVMGCLQTVPFTQHYTIQNCLEEACCPVVEWHRLTVLMVLWWLHAYIQNTVNVNWCYPYAILAATHMVLHNAVESAYKQSQPPSLCFMFTNFIRWWLGFSCYILVIFFFISKSYYKSVNVIVKLQS